MEKNAIITGIIIGAIVPVLGYFLVDNFFALLVHLGWMNDASGAGMPSRIKTIAIIAICCNILPLEFAKRNRYDQLIKGIAIPTFFYAVAWIYSFKHMLLVF